MGAGKHCNICWALRTDVTFPSSMAFQTDSQAVTNPGGTLRLHLLTFIFTGSLSSVDGHCTPPSGLGQESDICGPWGERTSFTGRNCLEERKNV